MAPMYQGAIEMVKYISLFIASFMLVISAVPAKSGGIKVEKKEIITGVTIAQLSYMPCVYHPCALCLIVRVSNNKTQPPRYVQIIVEYFPDKFPTELIDKAKEWRFEVVRNKDDATIEKYIRATDSETRKDITEKMAIPALKLLSGAEKEKIPFGKALPSYFVRSGKYKAAGK